MPKERAFNSYNKKKRKSLIIAIQITSLKKKGRYFSLKATGDETLYRIHPDTMFEFSLYEGKNFSEEEWIKLIDANNYAFAWESTLRMLSIRAHCEQDLKNKLRQKKHTSKTVNKVLETCKHLELIDDAKFAKAYIAELKENGSGLQMIKLKLSKKGVSRELIEEELENSFTKDDEMIAAKIAFKKKLPALKREKEPRKRKEKLYRFMISKGFNYEIISNIMDSEEFTQL